MDAPISSPSQPSSTTTATLCQFSIPAQQQPQQQQQFSADPKMASAPVGDGGPQGSADTFLRDFTLVAEAAKRAQVAVMVRDLESCGIS